MEEFADCRIDHYQTPANVSVSVFARQVDKERSTVVFESEKVYLHSHIDRNKCLRDGRADDICAAAPVNVLTGPYRLVSACRQAFQTFSRFVWRNRSQHIVVQGFRHEGTAGTFEPSLWSEPALIIPSLSCTLLLTKFQTNYGIWTLC